MPSVADVAAFLDRFAPPATAAEWDNVGLLVGDPTDPADRVMTCLTVTPNVVAEAVADGVNLIVSHHPVLFRGAKKLTAGTPDGRLLLPLVRNKVAAYSPHTAFDNCPGGINDGLAARLGLSGVKPLRPRDERGWCKFVVFTPEGDLERVSDAVFAAGAGTIGQYEQCSYRTTGTGTFFGTETANPAVGQRGRREHVSEYRFEVIVPDARVSSVVAAMRAAHSYEMPAFDVYPLKPFPGLGGDGRVGELPAPVPLRDLAVTVKGVLSAAAVGVVGDPGRSVSRVAVACGAAGEFLPDAIRVGADVFLTGEMRFHDCLTAEAAGVGVLLPGHHATERPGVEDLAARLVREFPSTTVWASRRETDPVRWIGA